MRQMAQQPPLGAKFFAPSTAGTAAAASNTAAIQALLNVGGLICLTGSGTAYINARLTVYSNTRLEVDPALTIKLASASNCNMLVSNAFASRATVTNVTVTWISGITATVAWQAHPLSVGQFVWMQGLDDIANGPFLGVFRVLTAATDTFTIGLKRLPTVGPTGQLTCKAADHDITVYGGTWDYNRSAQGSTGTDTHALQLAGVGKLVLDGLTINNAMKYCVCLGALNDYSVLRVKCDVGSSDFIKIYGPAFDGYVEDVTAYAGDDFLSLQPRESDTYAAYRFSWGDVIGFIGRNFSSIQSAATIFNIYPCQLYWLDGVDIDGISGTGISVACGSVAGFTGETSQPVGTVKISGIAAKNTAGACVSLSTLANIKNMTLELAGAIATDQAIAVYAHVDMLRIERPIAEIDGASGKDFIQIFGSVSYLLIADPQISCPVGNYTLVKWKDGSVGPNQTTIKGGILTAINSLIDCHQAGFTGGRHYWSLEDCSVSGACVFQSQYDVTLSLKNCQITDAYNGIFRSGVQNPAITIYAQNVQILGSTTWFGVYSGAPAVSPKSIEIVGDVAAAYIARASGNEMYNTNTEAGTLGVAGPVGCQGTSEGSWYLKSNPSLVY